MARNVRKVMAEIGFESKNGIGAKNASRKEGREEDAHLRIGVGSTF